MPKREETREKGSGITRYRQSVIVFDMTQPLTEEEADEFGTRLKAAAARPLWDNARTVAEMRAALEDLNKGLPSDHQDSKFRPHEDLGWYYSRLILLDSWVQRDIAKGNAAKAAYNAAEFGSLFTELQFKLVWEREALIGRETLKGAHKGPKAKAESQRTAAKHDLLLAEYAVRRARGMEDVPARTHAAKAVGYSAKQAKRIIDEKKNGHSGANVR